jgi:hypothetical protein
MGLSREERKKFWRLLSGPVVGCMETPFFVSGKGLELSENEISGRVGRKVPRRWGRPNPELCPEEGRRVKVLTKWGEANEKEGLGAPPCQGALREVLGLRLRKAAHDFQITQEGGFLKGEGEDDL